MKARTMRAAFQEFFSIGVHGLRRILVSVCCGGELANSVLADLGNRTTFVEVFTEPGQQLLRGNRLRSVREIGKLETEGKQAHRTLGLERCHGLASADLEFVSPRSQLLMPLGTCQPNKDF